MKYEIDFDKWILTMLPTFLRRRSIFALCRSLCAATKTLYKEFLKARDEHLFALGHNGQVCYLRDALNQTFKGDIAKIPCCRGFEIGDINDNRGRWIYAKQETFSNQLYTVDEKMNANPAPGEPAENLVPIVYDEAKLNAPQNAFVVYVPSAIYNAQLDRVKETVEKYRILSKQPIYTPIS